MRVQVTVTYHDRPLTLELEEYVEGHEAGFICEGTITLERTRQLNGYLRAGWPSGVVEGNILVIDCKAMKATLVVQNRYGWVRSDGSYRVEALEALHELEVKLGVKFLSG